jgi:hypothetical protein
MIDKGRGKRSQGACQRRPLRSPIHKPHPDFGCDEFDEGEVVGVVFFEIGHDGSELFALVEQTRLTRLRKVEDSLASATSRGRRLSSG